MKLNIQYFGGRGVSSSKQYTTKDIKVARRLGPEYKNRIDAYELNGWYLLKDYGEGVRNNTWFNWAISKSKWGAGDIIDKRKAIDKGEYIYVNNFKQGKEKLIELANKKKKTRKIG